MIKMEKIFYDGKKNRYVYVGNPKCSFCGQEIYDAFFIDVLRNKKQKNKPAESKIYFFCHSSTCIEKLKKERNYYALKQNYAVIVSENTPKNSLFVDLNKSPDFSSYNDRDVFEEADVVNGEFVRDYAWRSKKYNSWKGASVGFDIKKELEHKDKNVSELNYELDQIANAQPVLKQNEKLKLRDKR